LDTRPSTAAAGIAAPADASARAGCWKYATSETAAVRWGSTSHAVVTGMGAKSLGPVTRAPGRVAEGPPGSERLTEAILVAVSATVAVPDASPTWAQSAGAHRERATATAEPRTIGHLPPQAGTDLTPQACRSGRDTSRARVEYGSPAVRP